MKAFRGLLTCTILLAFAPSGSATNQAATATGAEQPSPPTRVPVIPDPAELPPPQKAPSSQTQSAVQSLEALYKTIQSKQRHVENLRQQFQNAVEDVTRNQLLEELKEATDEAEKLNRQFEEFAVGVDISAFVEEEPTEFNWQDELAGLLRPIIAELKNATAETRVIGELRNEIEEISKLEDTAGDAVANIKKLLAANPGPELKARLEADLARWSQRRDDAKNRRTALQLQLNNRLADRKSMLDETTGYAKTFFRTRGLNLVMGIGAFLAVFFGVRMMGHLYERFRPSAKGRTFSSRLGTLLFQLFSVIGGLAATLLVFNLAGDWFLLGIVLIFLLGVGWASINTLPAHVETIKLMLNIGAVKEGERIVFDDRPWLVESLAFSAKLVNPLLDGGVQILPVKHLVGMHSRPHGEDEEWFPSRQGDWVELADGRFGRVAYQTPSTVQVVELGGAQIVYQTPDYLAQSPRNLSTGFRVTAGFGIDYQHQVQATSAIPTAMLQKLEAELPAIVGAEALQNVCIEFAAAAASSLDYEVILDVDGSAAARLPAIRRAIQRLLVDACNEHGWVIPFQQVTVHQATLSGP